MKCQFCFKSAAYEITEINQGQTKSLSLCESCFQDYMTNTDSIIKKIKIPKLPNMILNTEVANKFVKDMMEFVENLVEQKPNQIPRKQCPKCNMSLKELVKKGKLGCPNCYEYYQSELSQVIYMSHGTPGKSATELQHEGKIPKNKPKSNTQETDKMLLTKLNYKLAHSVQQENYEQAAKLRDMIEILQEKINNEKPNPQDAEDQ